MMVDVTHLTRARDVDGWRIVNQLDDLVDWLDANVGDLYGRGEGDIWRIGRGWEIITKTVGDEDGYQTVSVVLDINDGPKATWAAMMWGTK